MAEEKTNNGAATADEAPQSADVHVTISAEELEALRKLAGERDDFKDLAQRFRAEFENYQKRNRHEREQEKKYWHTPLVLDLLPVFDNLERAVAAAQEAGETGPLVEGVAMVQSQFLDLLKRHGITRIDAKGKPFDPNRHQAVMQQPSAESEPNTVLQVLENGFMHHDRVLRPAKVVVSS
jgi:molecular chaperone GrpE